MSEKVQKARLFNFWALLPRWFRPATGAVGESLARRYLRRAGYLILDCNWRCPAGEVDIIAAKGSTLIFVEVKARSGFIAERFSPTEAVDDDKEGRIKRAADFYMEQNQHQPRRRRFRSVRFDVLAVTTFNGMTRITHYEGAFQ